MNVDADTYDERAALIWRLHNQGMAMSKIAKVTGIRRDTVHAILMDALMEGVPKWKVRHSIRMGEE